jgi:hypothetical protein
VFCACELKYLSYVVFCEVGDVHNFDFRLVINKKITK